MDIIHSLFLCRKYNKKLYRFSLSITLNRLKNKEIHLILVHVLVHTFPYLSRDLRN